MSDIREWEVKVEMAWRDYMKALDDHTMPYTRVVEYRTVYERILNDCPCDCEICKH